MDMYAIVVFVGRLDLDRDARLAGFMSQQLITTREAHNLPG
jgi:hypothetical protein